jgi:long-chain acyl-CoA synthetase
VIMDEDGFLRIVDRIKELIITGGFNVSPTEVEETLRAHPSVEEVSVVGIPREGGDEEVAAAIVPVAGAGFDEAELRAFARSNLGAYKVPRRIVEVDELPKSLIGKVLRRQVRERILATVDGSAGHQGD